MTVDLEQALKPTTPVPVMQKEDLKVYTFSMNDSPTQVQLLSTHTLTDLVTVCFERCSPVPGETANSHLWFIEVNGRKYESYFRAEHRSDLTFLGQLQLRKGTSMRLVYDYGSTSTHTIIVDGTMKVGSDMRIDSFPREKPMPVVQSSLKFHAVGVDLDTLFKSLNIWCREGMDTGGLEINLFQAGRRTSNYGFLQRTTSNLIPQLCLLPDRPESLDHYLSCLNHGASIKADGFTTYSWHSIVVLPNAKKEKKYNFDTKRGFCDCEILPNYATNKSIDLGSIFPYTSAFAGLRKSTKKGQNGVVRKKGWIRYKDNVLMVCSGSGSESTCPSAPRGTAFHGRGQHVPSTSDEILVKKRMAFTSIHDLFCTVEGLLRQMNTN